MTEKELRAAIRNIVQTAWDNDDRKTTWGELKDSIADRVISLIKEFCWLKGEK